MATDVMTAPPPSSLDAADAADGLDNFIGKWRARWPEWSVAEVFLPPAQRPVALAWAALQQELTDAAWGGSDARPGEAKLMWWSDELHGWAAGRRRHPLGVILQRLSAPWTQLAAALPSLQATRERAGDTSEAFALLLSAATAAASIEQALFASAPSGPDGGIQHSRLIGASWLQARLLRDPQSAVPLAVLARAGGTADAALAAWQRELWIAWPPVATGIARPRRLWAALARARLARGGADRPLSAWAALWSAWRAARD